MVIYGKSYEQLSRRVFFVVFFLDTEITTFAGVVEFMKHMLISLPSTERTARLWASIMQLYAAVPRRYLSLTAIRWTPSAKGCDRQRCFSTL